MQFLGLNTCRDSDPGGAVQRMNFPGRETLTYLSSGVTRLRRNSPDRGNNRHFGG
jgi:hypothetical protein